MRIHQDIKRIIHHNQVELTSWNAGWFNIQKSLNIIHHIKRLKKKNHMMNISIAEEKAFDKIKHPFLIKPSQQTRNVGNFFKLKKPTANTILNGKRLNVLTLRSGSKQGCPVLPLLFSIIQVLASAMRRKSSLIRHKTISTCQAT